MILKILLIMLLAINFASCINHTFKKTNIMIASNEHQNKKFGFFSSKLWVNYKESLNSEIKSLEIKPSYILWYTQFAQSFPTDIVEYNKNLKIYTIISHDLRSDNFNDKQNENILKEIVDGKWDNYLKEFAKSAKKLKIDVYYRFGYEMNGRWFPWGKKPEFFAKAWIHTWKIFKKEGANNIKWIYSPNVIYHGKNYKNILQYYPGSEFVDIVSLDGYNFGNDFYRLSSWKSFAEIYNNSTNILKTLNKPMWITEIGCPIDPRREEWLNEFLKIFNNSNFEVFIWFNEHKANEPDFRLNNDTTSLSIIHEWLKK